MMRLQKLLLALLLAAGPAVAQNGGVVFNVPVSGGGTTNVISGGTNGMISVRSNAVNVGTATNLNFVFGNGQGFLTNVDGLVSIDLRGLAPGSSTNAIGRGITNLAWSAVAFVDATNGNNSTAVVGDATKPFKDPRAAKNAAGAGWLVYVRRGAYSTNDLLKNGVDWYFEPGTTLIYSNTAVTSGDAYGIFDDRSSGACTSSIVALGTFIQYKAGVAEYDGMTMEAVTSNPNVIGAIVMTNELTRLNIKLGKCAIESFLQGPVPDFMHQKNGHLIFSADEIKSHNITNRVQIGLDLFSDPILMTENARGLYWALGDGFVNVGEIRTSGYCLWGDLPRGQFTNNYYYEGVLWENFNSDSAIYMDQVVSYMFPVTTWKTWGKVSEIRSAAAAYAVLGSGSHYLSGVQKIVGNIGITLAAGVATNKVKVWIDAQKVGARSSGIQILANAGSTSEFYLNVGHIEDEGGMTKAMELMAGNTFIDRTKFTATNATTFPILYAGQKAVLDSVRIDASWSTNSPLLVRSNGLTLRNCTLMSTNTQFSITTDQSPTLNVRALGSYATSDATNKVNVLVGPWTVDTNLITWPSVP